ncbi:peptidylprolyl isomerase [Apibacter muscae]|uniref:peptidylprolyl isomerase n=1 Tax=Apibacter muscae TaxID=2509004 RepID=UPI0011ADE2B9|nr:peptidylprolyl isomerase [Apibacter muscae]TWP28190.1 peptidylprolyl isomerase [Apibacter muscae]
MNRILLILTFFASLYTYSQERKLDGIVAVVGDEIITDTDIFDAENYAKSEGQQITDRCDFLENMMKEKIILYKAKQDTLISVSKDEVNREVDSRLDGYKNYFKTDQELLLNFKFKTMAELRSVLETMVRNQMYTQRKMFEITKNVDISPEYLRAFYQAHENEFPYLNDEIEYAQILMYPQLTDAHKQELINQLKDIKKQIQEGASFAEMAKTYSEDPGSAPNGGQILNVRRGIMVKEFDAVAFSLGEGEISEPFETEYGYHIIYLEKKRGQIIDLRHILLQSKPNQEEIAAALDKLKKIREEIISDKITFNEAVTKYSDDKLTKYNGGLLSNQKTGDNRFERSKLARKDSYNLLGLSKGDVSEAFEDDLNNRTGVKLLKITEVIPSHKMNLETDYNRIKGFAEKTKQNEVVEKWVETQIPSTYIKVQDSYKNCKFSNHWLKN